MKTQKKRHVHTVPIIIAVTFMITVFITPLLSGVYYNIGIASIIALPFILLFYIGWSSIKINIFGHVNSKEDRKRLIYIYSFSTVAIIIFLIVAIQSVPSKPDCYKEYRESNIKKTIVINGDKLYKSVVNAIIDNNIQGARDLVSTTNEKNVLYDFIRNNDIQAARNYIKLYITYENSDSIPR